MPRRDDERNSETNLVLNEKARTELVSIVRKLAEMIKMLKNVFLSSPENKELLKDLSVANAVANKLLTNFNHGQPIKASDLEALANAIIKLDKTLNENKFEYVDAGVMLEKKAKAGRWVKIPLDGTRTPEELENKKIEMGNKIFTAKKIEEEIVEHVREIMTNVSKEKKHLSLWQKFTNACRNFAKSCRSFFSRESVQEVNIKRNERISVLNSDTAETKEKKDMAKVLAERAMQHEPLRATPHQGPRVPPRAPRVPPRRPGAPVPPPRAALPPRTQPTPVSPPPRPSRPKKRG